VAILSCPHFFGRDGGCVCARFGAPTGSDAFAGISAEAFTLSTQGGDFFLSRSSEDGYACPFSGGGMAR